jgi:bifunctional UDP-N-acetylglucosamine pyrophosphorylase/glucosamine-1-phosphate N-acetyltransferase
LQHVLAAAARWGAPHLVITGHGADAVEPHRRQRRACFVRQMPQLGTGHAVQQVVPCCPTTPAPR